MMKKRISVCVIIIGLILFFIGLFMSIPGTNLTTYESLDGYTSSEDGQKYSTIIEYVGGDAYNYIIGASLVGGEIAGAKTQKAIFISVGLLIASIGALCSVNLPSEKNQENIQKETDEDISSNSEEVDEDESETLVENTEHTVLDGKTEKNSEVCERN